MSAGDLSALWRNRLANQYHANYEPRCGSGLHLRHAVPLRHRAARQVRRLVRPEPVRRGGAGAGLREHQGAVRGVHRPRPPRAAAVHRHDLLADEQGVPEPAVEPVRQRRRPGGQLFRRRRRRTGRCTSCTPWTPAPSQWTTWADRHRPACRCRPGCTAWPERCWTARPRAASRWPASRCAPACSPRRCRPGPRPRSTSWNWNCASTGHWWTATCTGCPPSRT